MKINDPINLRKRFELSGRSITLYARVKGLQKTALERVLNGEATGERTRAEGQTRKVFAHLKADGIYIGALPWEKCEEKSEEVA
ncbi:MAG: hypothetical protein AB7D43_12765 [Sulfurimonadaceae bacterium]|jgi:hypothetical protein